ncbi:hypothetical protein QN277_029317 [Acacia crassicarpa]|uniref:Bet v I/Major latex protein domain-containing protein n=1 Tax=Acacia crassicarpa TaxID=499986 RepID=A0AAE1J6S6_9FABA|nr:hypothetical protein QN277_029317 [Acacia crassicarpa]
MALTGKLEVENETPIPASEFFQIFTKKLDNLQNITDHIHEAELHEGEDWHNIGSVKQWTLTVGGKVVKFNEKIEAYDEENKLVTFNLFEGDIQEQYKSLKITLKVTDKVGGRGRGRGAVAKWIVEYEKLNQGIPDPTAYVDLVTNIGKDVSAVVPPP